MEILIICLSAIRPGSEAMEVWSYPDEEGAEQQVMQMPQQRGLALLTVTATSHC